MTKKHSTNAKFWKRVFCMVTTSAMVFSMFPAFSLTASAASTDKPALLKAGSVPVSSENYTLSEPFPEGTGGSDYFRIPALITLKNGDLLATADARYQVLSGDGSAPDGGGLDTIASVSSDGGKTWHYSFPIYFPDSNLNAGTNATTIIDPGLVEGADGTIYCIADVNPTGVTTMNGYVTPGCGTGYIDVEGTQRLALTSSFSKSAARPDTSNAGYEYYVGDFENGYAPVLNISDHTASDYCVDEWLNLYKITNGTRTELKQSQVDSNTQIQQNVFYRDSDLHVYKTGYLWLVTSTDHGHTWGNPTILNTQIKRNDDENDQALLVSPGKGICTKSGDIVIGFYNYKPGRESASIVYSTDNGNTWQRTEDMATVGGTEITTSSENEIVELEDGTLRMFFRHGGYKAAVGNLCYVDAKKQADGSYKLQTPVVTAISAHTGCNLSVLSYSRNINGKQVILVSVPSDIRANGQILTLLVDNDSNHTMTCLNRYSVPGGQGDYGTYVYSCLTELEDGSIGLLWEPSHKAIRFNRFLISETGVPSPYLYPVNVELKPGSAFTVPNYEGAKQITTAPDKTIATISFTEERSYSIFNHIGTQTSGIQAAFSASPDSALHLSNAEFVFETGSSADKWIIKNAFLNRYLTNPSSADFYSTASGEMLLKKVASNDKTYFQISKSENSRILFFYPTATNLNSQESGIASGSDANLLLLEKQDTVSESDVIPGYQQADSITSGKSYLITYMAAADKFLVLYPDTANNFYGKTKLVTVGNADSLVITGIKAGYTEAVIDDVTYEIHVTEDSSGKDPICTHEKTTLQNARKEDCENDGYSGDLICNQCGAVIERGDTISATGHDWNEGTVTKPVTLTEDGARELICNNNETHKKTETIDSSVYALFMETYNSAAETKENLGMYENDAIELFLTVYEEAKQIAESGRTSNTEMNHVKSALSQAQTALTPRASDALQTELAQMIASAAPDAGAQGNIPNEIWTEFKTAYDNAQKPIPDNLSEEEKAQYIWNLSKALQTAQKNFNAAKDALAENALTEAKNKLSQAVAEAKNIYEKEQSLYTPDSWKIFEAAYIAAKTPPENADADTLNTLLTNLTNARSKLVKISGRTNENETPVYNDVTYRVLNESKKTAAAVACTKTDAKKITIAAAVKIKNQTYKVVQIDAKAFNGCTALKQVTIGKHVTTIGKQCFSGCKKLTKITFKGIKLKTVKSGAFKKTAAKITVKVPKKLKSSQRTALLKKMKKAGISKKAVIK